MPKRMVLQQYFGYDDFRPGQEPLIDGILAGRDVLGIMPTGGGKSMCYQIPALLLPGLTLVVSPLISLMKDQVAALNGAGIPAALLNSSLDEASYRETCWQLRQGMHKLLYVAPERLENEGFLRLMQEQEISMIAVDEAHCVSQWGQDFRPSYLKIPDFVTKLPHRPVVSAFTATATAEVQADIVQRLELIDPVKIVTGFDRPNLYFEVRRPTQKLPLLTQLVEDRAGRSGIIYCATRANVEKVCDHLRQRGIPATRYHAGLSEAERRQSASCSSPRETWPPPSFSSTRAGTTTRPSPRRSWRRSRRGTTSGWRPWWATAKRLAACGGIFWTTSASGMRHGAATAATAAGRLSRWTSPARRR